MNETTKRFDFESFWQDKFSRAVEKAGGPKLRDQVMQGSEGLSMDSDRTEVIAWSQEAMQKLDRALPEEDRIELMTSCACHAPEESLADARRTYRETGSVDRVMEVLQAQFETFLKQDLALAPDQIQTVVDRGMGMAGVWEGTTVIATKIPKSGYLKDYLEETDPDKRRQMYCHCPRIRAVLETNTQISPTYCYCGAGFYKALWETILEKPVRVKLLRSVLAGDDVCQVAVHLPEDAV